MKNFLKRLRGQQKETDLYTNFMNIFILLLQLAQSSTINIFKTQK